MNIFYSLMGWVAQQSDSMSRQRINLIPLNWLLIIAGPLIGLGALFSSTDGAHLLWAVPLAIALFGFAALLLLSWSLRNVIFQQEPSDPALNSALGNVPVASDVAEADVVFTGKLRLEEKVARRFLAVPARIVTLENGARAFASNIDASSRLYGMVTKARAGTWLSIPREGTLQAQSGVFYHGFAGRPALRLRYTDELDGSQNSTIVAFESAAEREAARVLLGARGDEQTALNPAFSS